ncbi:MAG: DUF5320 domain-containing protein [Caldisericia bacterium]|jgi:hypothetical protein|nr:DUF5320 domain-containing protein [Caldisericia bacterium]
MRRWFRRHCFYFGFPPFGFYGRFGFGLGPWWHHRMSREEEKEYLEDLKEYLEELREDIEKELEEIKKRLEELK